MVRQLSAVAVYCGSNFGNDPAYAAAAASLGGSLAERGIRLVYGGGQVGLMGVVADAVLDSGGEVLGVITEALVAKEVSHQGLAELREAGNEGKGPLADRFILALRDRGYWGLAWPTEYGGLGRSAIDQWIFVDELESAGAPMLPLTATTFPPWREISLATASSAFSWPTAMR